MTARTVVVLLAGGIGTRVGLGIPKQLIKIAGKAIVEHTLEAIEASPVVDEILVVMNAGAIDQLEGFVNNVKFPKLSRIIPGGETRNESTQAALDAIEGDADTKVLFHDAVRPFVDTRILEDCVQALDRYDAVDTAIRSADTIIQIDPESNVITHMPDRSVLRRGQTPQGFRLGTIRRAYDLAALDPDFHATDDCGVIFTYLPETAIYVVEGTPENMKVTEPIDIHIADKIFQLQSSTFSPDEQIPDMTGKVVVVFGGSSGIGESTVQLASQAGASVHQFSRSTSGTDIRSRAQVKRALASVFDLEGRIDAVVVTAGDLNIGPVTKTKVDRIRAGVETNFLAPIIVARAAHRYLQRTSGQLLLFTSSSHTRGRANYGVYSASKAAVVNLTQSLAEEWMDDGVAVNCISPQRTRTPMRINAFGDEPPESLLAPEDVASVSLQVLNSDLTGQVISVRVEDAARRSAD